MFTNQLRTLRENANIKQKDIAAALHIKPNTYNRYECGVNEPDIEMLIKLADFFHVSVDFLLGHTVTSQVKDLTQLIMTSDYKIFDKAPTMQDRKKLAKFIEIFFDQYHLNSLKTSKKIVELQNSLMQNNGSK